MTRRRSLERRIALWFAATLVVLYGVVAAGLWGTTRERGREYAKLTLKTEAETVANYVGATGRKDAPELAEAETEPFPIWIRLVDGAEIVAATPGAPDVPAASPESTDEALYLRPPGARKPMLVVRHAVGGRGGRLGSDLAVEAIGDLSARRAGERQLASGLAVLGLVIIPLAASGGRLLARRALAPLGGLVREIGGLDPESPGKRLGTSGRAVEEVQVLAEAFNDVLERLELALWTMRRFTADASHEIRNPLAVMRTGLEVALRHPRASGQYEALLRENLDEIDRLQSILDGLLTLARAEPGSAAAIQRQTVDLAEVARETVSRFSSVIAESGSRIVAELPAELVIEGDVRLLRLVVFNLLDNALKHGPAGQAVTLALSRAEGCALLKVSDQGPGIAPEHRPHVFERYYRRTAGSSPEHVGGLGLSVVRWVAEAHDGSVALVDSARGATFEVRLPALRLA